MKAYLLKMDNETGETTIIASKPCLQYQSAFMLFEDEMILDTVIKGNVERTELRKYVNINRQTYTTQDSIEAAMDNVYQSKHILHETDTQAVTSVVVKAKGQGSVNQYIIVCANSLYFRWDDDTILDKLSFLFDVNEKYENSVDLETSVLTNRGIYKICGDAKITNIIIRVYSNKYSIVPGMWLDSADISIYYKRNSTYDNWERYKINSDLTDLEQFTQAVYDTIDSIVEKCKQYN